MKSFVHLQLWMLSLAELLIGAVVFLVFVVGMIMWRNASDRSKPLQQQKLLDLEVDRILSGGTSVFPTESD